MSTQASERNGAKSGPAKHRAGAAAIGPRHGNLAQLSRSLNAAPAVQRLATMAPANRTGLPDGLKRGVETLSGVSLDDVKVHRNSPEPARLDALAFAQGSDIHLASGQERHLPHEAWHVAQQAQGRVKPTMQMKTGTVVNDDPALEQEADQMGAAAVQLSTRADFAASQPLQRSASGATDGAAPVQMILAPIPYRTSYVGPLTALAGGAVASVVTELNNRVDAAYQQALQWQTLANNPDPLVALWYQSAQGYAADPDQEPRIISARFGYAIESIACQGLNNSRLYGLDIQTQVGHGHTRPDVVAYRGDEQVAWLDITSVGSTGHILGKGSTNWATRPFIYEIVYPQLRLRALLNAMNDPYYTELGGMLADEKQIDLDVKDRSRATMRARFVGLRDRRGWTTGRGEAGEKKRVTRDFFMGEAADEGVEDETQSIVNTKGALRELEINDGPFGFNVGGGSSSNRRINQVVDAMSADEIAARKADLHGATTHRLIGELRALPVPPHLVDALDDERWLDPGARGTALSAMALKAVAGDLNALDMLNMQIHTTMDGGNHRVVALEQAVARHLAGPASINLDVIMAWRRGARALQQLAQDLTLVLRATADLHRFTVDRRISIFERPREMVGWFQRLAQDPPDAQVARHVLDWLHQQHVAEAWDRYRRTDLPRLDMVYQHVTMMMPGNDRRVAALERDIEHQLGVRPAVQLNAIIAWRDMAAALEQRAVVIRNVLRARSDLDVHCRQRGLFFGNRPPAVGNFYLRLDSDPPDPTIANDVAQWIANN